MLDPTAPLQTGHDYDPRYRQLVDRHLHARLKQHGTPHRLVTNDDTSREDAIRQVLGVLTQQLPNAPGLDFINRVTTCVHTVRWLPVVGQYGGMDLVEKLPLPFAPPFAVVAPARPFGKAWIELWQQVGGVGSGGPLREVSVAAGDIESADGPALSLSTLPKLGDHRPTEAEPYSHGPAGELPDAVMSAVLAAINLSPEIDDEQRDDALASVAGLVDELSTGGWESVQLRLDGIETIFRTRSVLGAWIAVADLPTTTLGIAGRSVALTEVELVSVNR